MRRFVLCLALMVACLAAPAGALAAPNTGATTAPGPAKPASSAATSDSRKRVTPGPGRSGNGPRTLEDIHIEGEIPVPQVLFVTARDQRRFTQFHHRRYLKTSLEVGKDTFLPSRIVLTRKPPAPPSPR